MAGRAVLNILEEGETWVVISLVGELRFLSGGCGLGQRDSGYRCGSFTTVGVCAWWELRAPL